MKIKLCFSIVIVLFLLSCREVKNDKTSKNHFSQKVVEATVDGVISPSDSTLVLDKATVGSEYILKDFPEHWSYLGIISDDYENTKKNKFSVYLEKIGAANNYKNIKKQILPFKIPKEEIVIKDDEFDSLNYPIIFDDSNLTHLFKLSNTFFVALFGQNKDKPVNGITKRIDLVVFNSQFNIISKKNILVEGNGDQHAFMRYFFIDDGQLITRHFYVYDGESSASSIIRYKFSKDGKIIID